MHEGGGTRLIVCSGEQFFFAASGELGTFKNVRQRSGFHLELLDFAPTAQLQTPNPATAQFPPLSPPLFPRGKSIHKLQLQLGASSRFSRLSPHCLLPTRASFVLCLANVLMGRITRILRGGKEGVRFELLQGLTLSQRVWGRAGGRVGVRTEVGKVQVDGLKANLNAATSS